MVFLQRKYIIGEKVLMKQKLEGAMAHHGTGDYQLGIKLVAIVFLYCKEIHG